MTNRKYTSGTVLSNIAAAVVMIAAKGGVEQRAGRDKGEKGRGTRDPT
jgi:hypothetical protein